MEISVCIAAYNGYGYIANQIQTILPQLGPRDELIIVDDCSSDNTVDVIKSIKDPRLVLVKNSINLGHVRTFEKAIRMATKEIIVLSDQDDLWPLDRIKEIKTAFMASNASVVVGNLQEFTSSTDNRMCFGRIMQLDPRQSFQLIANLAGIVLGRRPYYGSAMAFTSKLKTILLPFPAYVESHDIYIAMAGIIHGGIFHLGKVVTYRRIHCSNLTPLKRRKIAIVFKSRFRLIRSMLTLLLVRPDGGATHIRKSQS